MYFCCLESFLILTSWMHDYSIILYVIYAYIHTYILPLIGIDVIWDSNIVELISPTEEECEEVMEQLEQQDPREHWMIILKSASPESIQIVLCNINKCPVKKLDIRKSPLNSDCVSELSHVLTNNEKIKYLHLGSSFFPPNGLEMIMKALSNSTSIKRLTLHHDNTITDKNIHHITDMLAVNTTLERLILKKCPNVTKSGEQQLFEEPRVEIIH